MGSRERKDLWAEPFPGSRVKLFQSKPSKQEKAGSEVPKSRADLVIELQLVLSVSSDRDSETGVKRWSKNAQRRICFSFRFYGGIIGHSAPGRFKVCRTTM